MFSLKELLHELLALLRDGLTHHIPKLVNRVAHVGGQRLFLRNTGLICSHFTVDEVDNPHHLFTLHDRGADGAGRNAEHFAQLFDNFKVINIFFVKPADKENLGKTGLCGVIPPFFGADARAVTPRDTDQSGLGNPDTLHDFTDEVKVSGSINKIDFIALEFYGVYGCRNGNLALDLFGIKIAHSVSVGKLAEPVCALGQKECRLGQGGLSRSALSEQNHISDFVNGVLFHYTTIPFSPYIFKI
ncbi:hypothetical protein SDC9_92038 [bioreactor metagenome]|uniref:Uncharacterized protein n=1 Tax=bioreactor metagenome TaxID=1076179 RepID=A0A644ZZG2_9ZZZZ